MLLPNQVLLLAAMMTPRHDSRANENAHHVQIVTNESSSVIVNILLVDDVRNVVFLATMMTGRQSPWTRTKLTHAVYGASRRPKLRIQRHQEELCTVH